jgi:cysteinyl-tRNA synthetase
MQKINIYNTATRKKEEFKPIEEGKVGIYSCGPTVYSSPHIGNMYAYVVWDELVRTLKYLGYEVHQVINVTDVGHLVDDSDDGEDKMEKGSKKEGLSAWDLAKKYEAEFVENLKMLNIEMPWKMPRATDHIKEQIELIQKIEANGFTYRTSDGIYYDTSKFGGYNDFAHLDPEKIKARVEENKEKKSPADFALWKFSPNDGTKRQMEWESPWGVGFPGWHIECTAMSTKYLGNPFDIHTGGEDHIAIHHTNEIAQGFGAWGRQTANYWMHNAFITFNGGKISKSTGGLFTVFDLQKMGFDPLAYRYMVLGSHYRKGMSFSEDSLKAAQTALTKLNEFVSGTRNGGMENEEYIKMFGEKIADDLAMPEVMALVWKLVKDEKIKPEDRKATLLDFDRVLGLDLGRSVVKEEIPAEIKKLAEERLKARTDKNWSESDRLRDLIKNSGYLVEDVADGYKLKIVK